MTDLPTYVVINNPDEPRKSVLRTPARELTFPLSPKDMAAIQVLEAKFDQEENMAGLAAPQIGFDIRAIIFEVKDDPILKRWRPDLTQTMPKVIWLNPRYKGIGHDKHTDYEGCFSVYNLAGPVARYKKVHYSAYTIDGDLIEGEAEGMLARVIQHEVDHLNGRLCIDLVPKDKLLTIEEYRARRKKAMETGEKED